MAGEDVEVAVQLAHVHRHVRHRLSAVQQYRHALGVGQFDNLLHRQDCAERVGYVSDGHQLGARRQHPLVFVQQQLTGVVNGNHPQHGALFLAEHLPGDNVGVMLHVGDDNLVAFADVLASVGLSDDVDALGGAAGIDNLVVVGGVEQPAQLGPRVLVVLGSVLAQRMDAAMHVGVLGGVVADNFVYDRLGLLGSRAVVEVDQRLSVDQLSQDWEIGPNFFRIETRGHLNFLLNLPA